METIKSNVVNDIVLFITLSLFLVLLVLTVTGDPSMEIISSQFNCILTNHQLVESFSKFSWPVLILIIIFIFNKDIKAAVKKLVERVESVGKDGVIFSQEQAQQFAKSELGEKNKDSDSDIFTRVKNLDNPLITFYMKKHENEINEAVASSGVDKETWLTAMLINKHLSVEFEKIHKIIFGSQIKILSIMASRGGKITKPDAEVLYNEVKLQYPEIYNEYTFDQWIGFLIQSSLVLLQEDKFVLTIEGSAFLEYIFNYTHRVTRMG